MRKLSLEITFALVKLVNQKYIPENSPQGDHTKANMLIILLEQHHIVSNWIS